MHVAVKTVPDHATFRQRIEFLNEASVMKVSIKEVSKVLVRDRGTLMQPNPGLPLRKCAANKELIRTTPSHSHSFPACVFTKKDIISYSRRYELLLVNIL